MNVLPVCIQYMSDCHLWRAEGDMWDLGPVNLVSVRAINAPRC